MQYSVYTCSIGRLVAESLGKSQSKRDVVLQQNEETKANDYNNLDVLLELLCYIHSDSSPSFPISLIE